MPAPSRLDNLQDLTDEALGCHAIGHIWWVTRMKSAGITIGKEKQYRRYFACARGCGCTKTALGTRRGREKGWGWSRRQGENYGVDGGWRKDDYWDEVERREASDDEWEIPGPGFGFGFDEDNFELVPRKLPKSARKKIG